MLSEITEPELALHSTACFSPVPDEAFKLECLLQENAESFSAERKMLKKFMVTVTKLYGKARTGKNTVLVCLETRREARGSSPTIRFLDKAIK